MGMPVLVALFTEGFQVTRVVGTTLAQLQSMMNVTSIQLDGATAVAAGPVVSLVYKLAHDAPPGHVHSCEPGVSAPAYLKIVCHASPHLTLPCLTAPCHAAPDQTLASKVFPTPNLAAPNLAAHCQTWPHITSPDLTAALKVQPLPRLTRPDPTAPYRARPRRT